MHLNGNELEQVARRCTAQVHGGMLATGMEETKAKPD